MFKNPKLNNYEPGETMEIRFLVLYKDQLADN